ncbi:hypothetical protein F511_05893 [Dorcoceras hygrometricum]|uniref:RIC1 C-terminal alpha solenoid region domain-containing protein n=1 Tax=Dorcoceras hygrometricum TaxID=472368 RepID=A0A2Z7D249_9LAMI|nr:hypothetical protein F511_05893 [Dorcoceras hygrometricum]
MGVELGIIDSIQSSLHSPIHRRCIHQLSENLHLYSVPALGFSKMYMAYGWPQVIPLELPSRPSKQQIVYLKVVNRLLLVVSSTHLELWSSSQHRVRLGKYMRDADSVRSEGENLQAVWSQDTKLITVITSSFYLHIFKVQITEKKIHIGGKQPTGLSLVNISLLLNEQVPFANKNLRMSNIICDNKHILIGLSDGALYDISWKGEFGGAFYLDTRLNDNAPANTLSYPLGNDQAYSETQGIHGPNLTNHAVSQKSAVLHLEYSIPLRLLTVLFSDGELVLCSVSKKGLRHPESIRMERRLSSDDIVCASMATEQQILAVGTRKGIVELYDLADSASLIRSVSLSDWGYSVEDTGPVNCIAWTPDNSVFAVGWKLRGLTVWSVSGCRLMSTISQIGMSSVSSPVVKPNQDYKYEPMMGGTSLMQWDEYGYRLYSIEERSSERIIVFSFGKCCLNRGVSVTTYVRQIIYGEDRLLVVQAEDTDELKILHLNLPVSYISQNWPVLHVAASRDGMYLAVAGLHGLILYDIRLKRWRVFGDITQEQRIQCRGLLWLGKIIVVCNYVDTSNMYELLFYPRYHLDQSSLLHRKTLLTKPVVMDVYQDYLLVTYRPFDVHIYHVKLSGELSPSSNPDLELSTVRELSIMTAKSHPVAMRFIPDQIPREYVLSLIDCMCLSCSGSLVVKSEEKRNLIEEVSWLDYGHRGMQLDPELEFDREVYPLGLLPNAGVVVGVSQRMSFSTCTDFPCFEPSPQAQTILHCLLRHLLQRDKSEEALRLAQISAEKPHFSHCLEWLLFTVFDAEISRQNLRKNQAAVANHSTDSSLLEKTCDLIKNFPEYYDVVVSVARKTDGRHWADLFSAAGRSTEYVIAKLEGSAVSQYCALRLLQATLDESLYELAGELVRFLLRSGREYEPTSTDHESLSPRFLGYFLFPSSFRKQPQDVKSPSFKEQNAHVASVKNILESHASYLMSGKELSKLVAFVKGTQFDLVEYLQRERYGSALLENFASGLEMIGQKLHMGTLQNRLDAEFLLAHMCSVKFKEWIVVLATLLRRSEVLFDLFSHDVRLWKAYSITIQAHTPFAEYHDLLEELEEKLSTVGGEEK